MFGTAQVVDVQLFPVSSSLVPSEAGPGAADITRDDNSQQQLPERNEQFFPSADPRTHVSNYTVVLNKINSAHICSSKTLFYLIHNIIMNTGFIVLPSLSISSTVLVKRGLQE